MTEGGPDSTARGRGVGPREQWTRWSGTLACVATAVLSAVVCWWLALRSQQSALGQALDDRAMDAVAGDESTTSRMVGILGTVSVVSIAVVVGVLVVTALLRSRHEAAIAAIVLVGGANVTTQVLKRTLERSDFGHLTVPSFPSGHATVVASLVMAALLVTPATARATVTLLGSAAMTVVAAATLVAGWHRPSDIIGAALVALAWGSAVLAVWSVVHRGVPHPEPGAHRIFATVGVVIASVLLVLTGVRPGSGWSGVVDASMVLIGIGIVSGLAVTILAHLSAPMAVGEPPA